MSEATKDANVSHQLAKARKSSYSAHRKAPYPYKNGQSVWIYEPTILRVER